MLCMNFVVLLVALPSAGSTLHGFYQNAKMTLTSSFVCLFQNWIKIQVLKNQKFAIS